MNAPQRVPQQRALAPSRPAPLPPKQIDLGEYGDLTLSELGKVLAASGYFAEVKDAAQAITKVLWGRERGVPPIQAMMGVNIIKNKLVPSADLMASMIKSSQKYDYRVTTLDDNGCTITFFEHGKEIGVSSFTREDAQKSGALSGANKNNWIAYFRNMCFARAMTNGARWFVPDVFGGAVYSAEELGVPADEQGDVITVAVEQPKPAKATPTKPATDASFRERLNQPVTIRAEVVAETVIEADATVIDVVAEPLKHDDLAEEPPIDRYDDLPAPPRPDAKFYDYDGDLPLWVVGPLICYERLVNNKPVLASVVYCAEHQKPFALRLTAANTSGWAHMTVQGQICNQYPVATISNPRTGEVLYDAGDSFPLDG